MDPYTVTLPAELYRRLNGQAHLQNEDVETMLSEVVSAYLDECEEKTAQVNAEISAPVVEKLRAAAFEEEMAMRTIVELAIKEMIALMEEQRGEAYEIYDPHRVD
jgi:Tfp pilus assembly pilus retraction ATPase PilT